MRSLTLRRLLAVSLLLGATALSACGESEQEKRRAEFEDQLRGALEGYRVPDPLVDCSIEVSRESLTDVELAAVPAADAVTDLAAQIAARSGPLAAACASSEITKEE